MKDEKEKRLKMKQGTRDLQLRPEGIWAFVAPFHTKLLAEDLVEVWNERGAKDLAIVKSVALDGKGRPTVSVDGREVRRVVVSVQRRIVAPPVEKSYEHHFRVGDFVTLRDGIDPSETPSLKANHPYKVTRLVQDSYGPCIALEGIDGHWFYEYRFRELPESVVDIVLLEKITGNRHSITLTSAGAVIRWSGPDGAAICSSGATVPDAVKAFLKAVADKPAPVDPYAEQRARAKAVLAGKRSL